MAAFKGFIVKEFKQIYRDKRTLVVLFGMPVIMLVLFGYAIRNEVRDASVAVLDHSKDEMTRQLIQKVEASNYFTIERSLRETGEIEGLFRKGAIDGAIILEKDFARKLKRTERAPVQVIVDASNPNLSRLIQAYALAIIRDFEQSVRVSGSRTGLQSPGVGLHVAMLFNPNLESVNLFVPGLIAVILMLICALMTSISITREKEMGNMEILLVSPLRPYQVIVGKVLPYLVLSFADVLAVLLLAQWIFKVPFRGSVSLFLFEAFLFIITGLSLGVFISTRADNQQTAMMVSLAGLLLPTVLLSGFIFPIASMPEILQLFSNIIPARWFLVIVRSIMLKDAGLGFLWKETLIIAGMNLLFIGLSIKNFKVRLE